MQRSLSVQTWLAVAAMLLGLALIGSTGALAIASDASLTAAVDDDNEDPQPGAAATGPTSSGPIALTSDNKLLVSVNPDADSVSVFDVSSDLNKRLAQIKVGREPRSVAISPDDKVALVTDQASGTVSVIDLKRLRRTRTIKNIGTEPYGVAFTPDGSQAWVANSGSGDMRVLEYRGRRWVTTDRIAVGEGIEQPSPRGVAITNRPDNEQFVYVTQFNAQLAQGGQQANDIGRVAKVFVLSSATRQRVATVSLASHPTGFDADRSAFGGNPVTPTSAFPNQLQSIFIQGNRAYVPNVAASPDGPVRFDVDTQAFLSVIDTGSNTEASAQTININLAVKQQTAAPKLFPAVPWAVAFQHQQPIGYVVSAASNVLARITLDVAGAPTVTTDNVVNGTRVREINVGKNPLGLVISTDDKRAYVMNYVSRDISEVDLTQNPEKEIARLQASALPAPGTFENTVQVGKELFNTSIGDFDQTDPATGQPVRGRMSTAGWQACASCHPSGLTDGVVWSFATGPRKSIPLNTTFNPHNPNQARILNYSAIFDEVQDFELNIRTVSGGKGVIVLGSGPNPVDPEPNVKAFDPANTDRTQLTVKGVDAMDAIAEYVRRGIRSPEAPAVNAASVLHGRELFIEANCQSCHGGSNWTSSIRNFTPPPAANELATGTPPEPGNQFLPAFLREVGTFDKNNPVEKTQINQQALGQQGFSPASLIDIVSSGPYNHNGACETLSCVLDNPTHRNAGLRQGVLNNADDRVEVVKFLRTIDKVTKPIADKGFVVSAEPGNLRLGRGTSGSYALNVDGNGSVKLELDPARVPAGVTATLSKDNGNAPFDTTLTVTASAETTNGQAFFSICGVSGAQRECIERGLNVFGFSLASATDSASLAPGEAANFTLMTESLGGDVPDVQLAVNGLPDGVVARFDNDFGTPYPDWPFMTNLVVETSPDTSPGRYVLHVTGDGEGLGRAVDLVLDVSY